MKFQYFILMQHDNYGQLHTFSIAFPTINLEVSRYMLFDAVAKKKKKKGHDNVKHFHWIEYSETDCIPKTWHPC